MDRLGVVRVALWVLAVDFAVLAGTGVWLDRRYQPGPAASGAVRALTAAHWVGAAVFVLTAIALATRAVRLAPAAALLVCAFAFVGTGIPLAWNQLALRSVITDSPRPPSYRGVWPVAHSRSVRLILGHGRHMTGHTLAGLDVVHAVALSAAAAACWVAVRRKQPIQPTQPTPAEGETDG